MMRNLFHPAALAALGMAIAGTASAQVACILAGPQTPRDISSAVGRNTVSWPFAPAPTQMNLCDIHTHTNAEHKGPGFSVFAGDGVHGGYKCNDTEGLSDAERADDGSTGTAVRPGDTIEVHWVHTTCDVAPAPGLGSCLCDNADTGVNQQLRVETQVFLVVNDRAALDFSDFMHDGHRAGGYYQPKSLPADTGDPVQFLGSTTGSGYNSTDQCSSPKVTWSVRPQCARVDVATVNAWFAIKGDSDGKRPDGSINVFRETESQGIRQLVVNPALLAPIE